jgi:hypothetical protein
MTRPLLLTPARSRREPIMTSSRRCEPMGLPLVCTPNPTSPTGSPHTPAAAGSPCVASTCTSAGTSPTSTAARSSCSVSKATAGAPTDGALRSMLVIDSFLPAVGESFASFGDGTPAPYLDVATDGTFGVLAELATQTFLPACKTATGRPSSRATCVWCARALRSRRSLSAQRPGRTSCPPTSFALRTTAHPRPCNATRPDVRAAPSRSAQATTRSSPSRGQWPMWSST